MPVLRDWQKGGIMLQFPTNFQPDNICIDASTSGSYNYDISFTFNGDAMYGVVFQVYDYNTGDVIDSFHYYNSNYRPYKYNEQDFSFTRDLNENYKNKRDYIIQCQILQGNLAGTENVCDMIVTGGKVQELGASNTEIAIEKNIRNIYEWGNDSTTGLYKPTYDGSRIVAEMQLEIDNERHTILSYNPETGIIVLDAPYEIAVSQGMTYRIYANYIISPQYLIHCRRIPTLFFNMSYSGWNYSPTFSVTGSAGGWNDDNAVVWYQVKLYWYDTFNIGYSHVLTADEIKSIEEHGTLIDDSGKIYSEQLDYETSNCWGDIHRWGVEDDDETESPRHCSIYPIVTIKTRNGYTGKVGREYVISLIDDEMSTELGSAHLIQDQKAISFLDDGFMPISYLRLDCDLDVSQLTEGNEVYHVGVYRKEGCQWKPIGQCKPLQFLTLNAKFFDWAAPFNSDVSYRLVPTNQYGHIYYKGIAKFTVTTKSNAMAIIGLETFSSNTYRAKSQWLFGIDTDDPTLTFNIGNNIHTGYENYPSVSRIGVDYVTGSVSTDLAFVSCPDGQYIDNNILIKAWHKFIRNYDAYLLKDLKGNVFIVQITDTPTVSWKEQDPVRPTKINFNWIEVANVDSTEILFPNQV